MNKMWRNVAIWLGVFLLAVWLGSFLDLPINYVADKEVKISYSGFMNFAKEKKFDEIVIFEHPNNKKVVYNGKTSEKSILNSFAPESSRIVLKTFAPNKNDDYKLFQDLGINVEFSSGEDIGDLVQNILSYLIPLIFLLLAVFFLYRNFLQGGGSKILGLGRNKLKNFEKNTKVKFEDVAGIDEAKKDLEEIVEFLKNPRKFQRLGGQIPRGVLLSGPPGSGKTLLAKALAGEAQVPFFSMSGSDFVELFIGLGASRVRELFETAKQHSPCIIFIDEIDAIGKSRNSAPWGGNDERDQTLNQLLVEMDGFEGNEGVIVVGATNRLDILDSALRRPGRFDRVVIVMHPDINGREKILKVHSKNVPLAEGLDLRKVAKTTPGFSGADLRNLVNEAALLAAQGNQRFVTLANFEMAKDKIIMGAERRTLSMTEEERELTAYHEAGHAIGAYFSPGSDNIHKVTIVPRGNALGMVVKLPDRDKISLNRQQIDALLVCALAGNIAEEIFKGPEFVTTGASSDFQYATNIARSMVMEWGMSPKLGKVNYQKGEISNDTYLIIEQETQRIIHEAAEKARELLKKHQNHWVLLAKKLLEIETLDGDQVKFLFENDTLDGFEEDEEKKSHFGLPKEKKSDLPTLIETEKNIMDDKQESSEETEQLVEKSSEETAEEI